MSIQDIKSLVENIDPVMSDEVFVFSTLPECESVDIEVVCSAVREHQARVESREAEVPGLRLPTWEEVLERDYRPWSKARIVIDTAGKTEEKSFAELIRVIDL